MTLSFSSRFDPEKSSFLKKQLHESDTSSPHSRKTPISPTKTSFSSKKSHLQPKNHHPQPKTPTEKPKHHHPQPKKNPTKNQKTIIPNQKKSNQNIIIPKQQNVCHQQNTSQLKPPRCATVLPRTLRTTFPELDNKRSFVTWSWRLLNDRRDRPVISLGKDVEVRCIKNLADMIMLQKKLTMQKKGTSIYLNH